MRRWCVAIGVGIVATSVSQAQQTPARDVSRVSVVGTGSINGSLVDNEPAAQPVRRATVTLSAWDATTLTSTLASVTDDAGRFAFSALPAGRYTLRADKPGFVGTYYGAKRPGQDIGKSIIVLKDGEHLSTIEMVIVRGAVIGGRVSTRNGYPLQHASVEAMKWTPDYLTGGRTLRTAQSALTNDRGEYRIFGLAPGDYVIAVGFGGVPLDLQWPPAREVTTADLRWAESELQSRSGVGPVSTPATPLPTGPLQSFAPVYYPGTTVVENAVTIALKSGEVSSGVDVQIDRVGTATVHVALLGAPTSSPETASVYLISSTPGGAGLGPRFTSKSVRPDGEGHALFAGVRPGRYTVVAQSQPSAVWAAEAIVIQGDDRDVDLVLQRPVSVTGWIQFDGLAERPKDVSAVEVVMTAAGDSETFPLSGSRSVKASADGSFVLSGIIPGRFRITARITSQTRWSLGSVMAAGQDVSDSTLDIGPSGAALTVELTDRAAELSGALLDVLDRPSSGVFIILFSADRTLWRAQSRRIQAVRPDVDGRFAFANVPPGRYFLSAVTDVEQFQWFDPAFLDGLLDQSPISLTLGDGERKTQNLRMHLANR